MSDRQRTRSRTIHSRALNALGLEAATVMLGVARDLRGGKIKYRQDEWVCETACCIGGHTATRLGIATHPIKIELWACSLMGKDAALWDLFGASHPSDPVRAADAIERYIYDGADRPWEVRP